MCPSFFSLFTFINALLHVFSPPVRYLLKNNVSPDLCNEDGLTALHQVTPSDCVSTLFSLFCLFHLMFFPETEALMTQHCLTFLLRARSRIPGSFSLNIQNTGP